nr:MAG TPA: hypothetical protein [Caudoviricetes sp.]
MRKCHTEAERQIVFIHSITSVLVLPRTLF